MRSPRLHVVEDPAALRPWWVGALVSLTLLATLAWIVIALLRVLDGRVLAVLTAMASVWMWTGARRTRRRQREFAMRLLAAQPTPQSTPTRAPRLSS